MNKLKKYTLEEIDEEAKEIKKAFTKAGWEDAIEYGYTLTAPLEDLPVELLNQRNGPEYQHFELAEKACYGFGQSFAGTIKSETPNLQTILSHGIWAPKNKELKQLSEILAGVCIFEGLEEAERMASEYQPKYWDDPNNPPVVRGFIRVLIPVRYHERARTNQPKIH